MRTIIIDDEKRSCDVLVKLIQVFCPTIQLEKVCNKAKEGIQAIGNLKPELFFLDVDLQTMTGFELLNKLGFPNISFSVIFVRLITTMLYRRFGMSAIKKVVVL